MLLAKMSQIPCRFYERGCCRYGSQCKFSHQNIPSLVGEPSNSETRNVNSTAAESSNGDRKLKQLSVPSSLKMSAEEWANTPEFVPTFSSSSNVQTDAQPKSYAQVLKTDSEGAEIVNPTFMSYNQLCPYAEATGLCVYPQNECAYIHGEICELCGLACLHPTDEEQRKQHRRDCINQHERNMELSFTIANSKDKQCGICFEIIMEKSLEEQKFGILTSCNHCFCLSCIRKWRSNKQFENKLIRACPECRIVSDFVCPSKYWVETPDDKNKLIENYKTALKTKDCKYFKKGQATCHFGNKCFYLHALPNGEVVDVGPPTRPQIHLTGGSILLWDFLNERDSRWIHTEDEFLIFSDGLDSEMSDDY